MTMHYPQWNYITVPSFMFRCVTISELRLLKRKKKKKMKNLQNRHFKAVSRIFMGGKNMDDFK